MAIHGSQWEDTQAPENRPAAADKSLWREELAKRPSVRSAVSADYPQLLHAFLVRHDAHLLKLAA